MKTHLLLWTIIVSTAFAADPKFNSVSLDVKSQAARKNVRDDFKTDYGSYDKNYDRERAIEISVRTSGRDPLEVVVKSWWLGKPIAANERVLLAKTEQKLTLNSQFQKITSSSGNVGGRDLKLNAIGVRRTAGFKIDGWVVTIHDPVNGEMVAFKMSDGHLEQLIRPKFTIADLKDVSKTETQ